MNNYFDKRRFGLLCKNEVFSNYKMWSIYFVTIVGIYVGLAILMSILFKLFPTKTDFDPYSLNNMFKGFLFIGGYILTSLTFSDINNKLSSSLWFSIPGSTFEKYLVGALISSIGYSIFLILAFIIASIISSLLSFLIVGYGIEIFNPFIVGSSIDNGVREYLSSNFGLNIFVFIWIYILTNSLFLVGSIVFRKAAFIKTILATSVIQFIIFMIIGLIVVFIIKSGIYQSWDVRIFNGLNGYLEYHTDPNTFTGFMFKWVSILGIPFSIFFNVVGYLKLAEKEVKGGI